MTVMKQYTGTKIVNASPMTRLAYNDFRGWVVPSDENPSDDGYLVEYVDSGPANTDTYESYVSWSPKDVFEKSYLPSSHPLDRMAIENMQLIERLKPLDELLKKPKPDRISTKQWALLHEQQKHMTAYFNTLDERIEDLAAEMGI